MASATTMASSPLDAASRRHVHIVEERNEIREFPRVPSEDKAKLWMSRTQIRQNKRTAKEEVMMERTRELVKAKLVEETVLDEEDPMGLIDQVKALQLRLDEIMKLPKEEILAFLQTKYNWVTDCNDYFQDLPPNIQKAAKVLGYTEELWDEFSQQVQVFDKSWGQLTLEQQGAATELGYNEITWNGSLETDQLEAIDSTDDEATSTSRSVVVEAYDHEISNSNDDDDDYEAPMYDWGSTTSDDEEFSSDSSNSSSDSDDSDESYSGRPAEVVTHEISSLSSAHYELEADEDEFISNFLADTDLSEKTQNSRNPDLPSPAGKHFSWMQWFDDRLPAGWPYMAAATGAIGIALAIRMASPALRSSSKP